MDDELGGNEGAWLLCWRDGRTYKPPAFIKRAGQYKRALS